MQNNWQKAGLTRDFEQQLAVYQDQVNRDLASVFPGEWVDWSASLSFPAEEAAFSFSAEEEAGRAQAYALLGGGKRLRPVLVYATDALLTSRARGYLSEAPTPDETEALRPLVCAIEAIHNYSLVHDDLPCMDNDVLRHGRPTVHKLYDEARAVLTGDALLTRAFGLLAGLRKHWPAQAAEAAEIVAGLAGEMVVGQWQDLALEGGREEDEALPEMVRRKTSCLIEAPLLSVAALRAAPVEVRRLLEDFGEKLGIAFQIRDDILDVTADAGLLGKSVGKDAENHKVTFVTLYGLEEAEKRLEIYTKRALDDLRELEALGYVVDFFVCLTEWLLHREH